MSVARVTALARIRLQICELLESLPASEAAEILRTLALDIEAEDLGNGLQEMKVLTDQLRGPELPPLEVAAPKSPSLRASVTGRPLLHVVGAPGRSTLHDPTMHPFSRLFSQPAPLKVAILEYLKTLSEPVRFRQVLQHLHLNKIQSDDASVSQALREMKVRGFVQRLNHERRHYQWQIDPELADPRTDLEAYRKRKRSESERSTSKGWTPSRGNAAAK